MGGGAERLLATVFFMASAEINVMEYNRVGEGPILLLPDKYRVGGALSVDDGAIVSLVRGD